VLEAFVKTCKKCATDLANKLKIFHRERKSKTIKFTYILSTLPTDLYSELTHYDILATRFWYQVAAGLP